uniref:Uncharacterized protein n=1 Tax=Aegilops tauschii subsp. strangulata TaxID=200361 RepID=A0A453AR46_AEGTS
LKLVRLHGRLRRGFEPALPLHASAIAGLHFQTAGATASGHSRGLAFAVSRRRDPCSADRPAPKLTDPPVLPLSLLEPAADCRAKSLVAKLPLRLTNRRRRCVTSPAAGPQTTKPVPLHRAQSRRRGRMPSRHCHNSPRADQFPWSQPPPNSAQLLCCRLLPCLRPARRAAVCCCALCRLAPLHAPSAQLAPLHNQVTASAMVNHLCQAAGSARAFLRGGSFFVQVSARPSPPVFCGFEHFGSAKKPMPPSSRSLACF